MHAGKPTSPPPPLNRMTDACDNIALPQTSFAGGKYYQNLQSAQETEECDGTKILLHPRVIEGSAILYTQHLQ